MNLWQDMWQTSTSIKTKNKPMKKYTIKVHRTYEVYIEVPATSAEEAKEIVEWSTPEIDAEIIREMSDPHTIIDEVITIHNN